MSSDKKNEIKLRKTEKTLKKESNSNESDFSGNQIPELNSLNSFGFDSKTNIGDISSGKKQPAEALYKKRCHQKFSKIYKKTPVLVSLF